MAGTAVAPFTQSAAASEDAPAPRRAVASWALFDLANTIISIAVITNTFPVWASAAGAADSQLSRSYVAATLLTMLTAPAIGAWCDRTNRRILPLALLSAVCVAATAAMGLVGVGAALILYVFSVWGLQAGQLVYDSLLPDVTTPGNRGRVSGVGIAIGYLGSFVAIALGAAVRLGGLPIPVTFPIAAAAFGVLAIPCFLFVRERPRRGVPEPTARAGIAQLVAPLRGNRPLQRMVVARFLYANTTSTFLLFLAVFLTGTLGLTENAKDVAIAAGTAATFVAAFAWGRLADRIGTRRSLMGTLLTWAAGIVLVSLPALVSAPPWLFWVGIVVAGMGLGGIWTSDRPLLVSLVDVDQVGRTFGLLAASGRAAAMVGPILWALVTDRLALGRPVAMLMLATISLLALAVVATVPERSARA